MEKGFPNDVESAYLVRVTRDLVYVFFCSLKMHDESTSRQKVDDDVQEGAIPPYLLDRDQTQRAKVYTLVLPPSEAHKPSCYIAC
jgi:hypothetical protein